MVRGAEGTTLGRGLRATLGGLSEQCGGLQQMRGSGREGDFLVAGWGHRPKLGLTRFQGEN